MKNTNGKIRYKEKEYDVVFNFNVMEEIQAKYGTFDEWSELSSGEVNAKKQYEKLGKSKPWESLTDKEKGKYVGEPDIKAVIFAMTVALNEGIDIENEDNNTDIKHFTEKQVGRIISEIGFTKANAQLQKSVIESTKSEEKNA